MSFWRRLLHALGFLFPYDPFESEQMEVYEFVSDRQMLEDESQWVEEYWRRWLSLTPREQEVAIFIYNNFSLTETSERMMLSKNTVKTHLSNAMKKLGVHSQSDLRLLLYELFQYMTRAGEE